VWGNYSTLKSTLEGGDPNTAFRLGIRELTKAQISTMAKNIVEQLQSRAAPFASLADFIDAGILEKAIAATDTAPAPTVSINNNGQKLPVGSPGCLTQGDILQLIGHRLVARSDTFTIRAYGDVLDTAAGGTGKVESRVWVEATVQRTPVKHSTANTPLDYTTPTGSSVGNFGRQFKIINLRWLSKDEI
jgi:hypothetical protein